MFFLNDTHQKGYRMDVDLVQLWKEDKAKRFGNGKASYVENRDQLLNVDASKTEYLLGKRTWVTNSIFWLKYLINTARFLFTRYYKI